MKQTIGKFGDLAMVVTNTEVNYKTLFEEEVQRRHSMEGAVAGLRKRIYELETGKVTDKKALDRAIQFRQRVDETRRAIAARLLSASVVRDGLPQGDDMYERAEAAVDLADVLIGSLLNTDPKGR